ncbi:nitrate reductase [Consotaella aegiceratis]|uniref:nitrate reductase n=1 Tax=Consotaella aegiceratis TaxID=3097961 RepID=UPI002F423998
MDGSIVDKAVRTTCPYCGVGCGVIATPHADGSVGIAGDPDHPANFGRLCSKGSALGETLGLETRLTHPTIGGARASWDEALDRVASRFSQAIAEHGPDSVAFYVSGQLLTEDYYVANKLMKGFIGSANIDTNSRLCMASSVAGHRRAFGSDTVPGVYEDLEEADLVVLVGSNLAWCHPVLYQRLAAAKALRPAMKVVLVDPRRTQTADLADLHLPIAANGDAALFAGLLAHLAEVGAVAADYVARHTEGFGAAMSAARSLRRADIARLTGLPAASIAAFYDLFARTEKVVTVYSQGVNQSVGGTDKVNAIVNCHLATGRIGRRGMGPFSVTGQPNAMGGREVGGMANMLAAHMEIENPDHRALVRDFWAAPTIADKPGLKAVDLFEAVADGRIKALWIMGTNPVVSMPDADSVKAALKACPFVVVSDVVASTDTLHFADVALPAAAWGEKTGTVTNSERRISRQRAFLPLPGEARPDWAIVADVARRMGFGEAFAFSHPSEIFVEHARLSGTDNDGARAFDIGAFGVIGQEEYDRLIPTLWPQPAAGPARTRFFGEGGFYHGDGKARFMPAAPMDRALAAQTLLLNTGRVRDHWHTMTRTGLSPRLSGHLAEPFAEIAPDDAAARGIKDADLVEVTSARGSVTVRALVTERQQTGTVFVPMHWTGEVAANARVNALVEALVDPVSGQPGSKATPVRVARFKAAWYGFAVLTEKPAAIEASYWALARTEGGWRLELAGTDPLTDGTALAESLFGSGNEAERLAYHDSRAGAHRFAALKEGKLFGALWLAREPVAVSRLWAARRLTADDASADRSRILAGRSGGDRPDPGAIVCSCFSVGSNDIVRAVHNGGCISVEAVGEALKAGTNCGSCRSEIKEIIDGTKLRQSA